jgi:phage gp46-like protein
MAEYLIRADEGCAPDPFLLWDSVRKTIEDGTTFVCDWALAAPGADKLNAGGLQAVAALATAVYICLFTDAYVPTDHPLYYLADGDNRGWWGDGAAAQTPDDMGPLGSWLWLLERAPMVAAGVPIEQWAKTFAQAALAPLQTQGAVVEIVTSAVADEAMGRVELSVALYGADGALMFSQQFAIVWQQLATAPIALQ